MDAAFGYTGLDAIITIYHVRWHVRARVLQHLTYAASLCELPEHALGALHFDGTLRRLLFQWHLEKVAMRRALYEFRRVAVTFTGVNQSTPMIRHSYDAIASSSRSTCATTDCFAPFMCRAGASPTTASGISATVVFISEPVTVPTTTGSVCRTSRHFTRSLVLTTDVSAQLSIAGATPQTHQVNIS